MRIIENNCSPAFPIVRLRRLRKNAAMRDLLQETRLSVKDLIFPILVQQGITKAQYINSMPGIQRIPVSGVIREVQNVLDLGIRGIILFGVPAHKSVMGDSAYSEAGIVQQSIELIRKNFGDKVAIITDVCLCQYTNHGHCGIVAKNRIDNDKTIEVLGKVALSHANAGAHVVAPSAMMDGQVTHIRAVLDENGFGDVAIIGYSAKHASSLYAPFRDALHSFPRFGDRQSYQMPYTNAREAVREICSDLKEGADIVMIKPAIPYLDLIYQARKITNSPICAFSVSGEYSLIKAAALEHWIDESMVVMEFMTSIKRAGADIIISYYAKKMASLLDD
jgi:porphobilinogen synthase